MFGSPLTPFADLTDFFRESELENYPINTPITKTRHSLVPNSFRRELGEDAVWNLSSAKIGNGVE
jgi:hypothetical protein